MTFVSAVVIEAGGSGACIQDATIEIVAGQAIGRRVKQANGCSYWDPDYNATFRDIEAGVELRLRASAPGYALTEKSVIPATGAQYAVTFELSKIR